VRGGPEIFMGLKPYPDAQNFDLKTTGPSPPPLDPVHPHAAAMATHRGCHSPRFQAAREWPPILLRAARHNDGERLREAASLRTVTTPVISVSVARDSTATVECCRWSPPSFQALSLFSFSLLSHGVSMGFLSIQ
jgi:hypothetical protein